MKLIKKLLTLLVFANAFAAGHAAANPYQFEVAMTTARTSFSFSAVGQEISEDATGQGADLTYFFKPVNLVDGPLNEQVFLNKSSYVTALFIRTKSDLLGNDRTGLIATYVTDTDLIFDLDYTQINDNSNSNFDDTTEYSVGIGRYHDDRTSVKLTLGIPSDDEKRVTGAYKKIVDAATSGTYIGYSFRVGYVDTEFDSGYELGASGTYFLFNDLSLGAGVDVSKIGEDNRSVLALEGNYFFTPTVYGEVSYQNTKVGESLDISFTALRIGARF